MYFLKLLELNPTFKSLKREDQVSYLQKAYEISVDMIRLDVGLFPVIMPNQTAYLDKLSFKATMAGIGSEIAFKEVKDIIGVEFLNEYSYGDFERPFTEKWEMLIGHVRLDNYGFEKEIFDSVNKEHTTKPTLYNSKQMYRCGNFDDIDLPFFLMFAYQYPYPLILHDGDTYVNYHCYNIAKMLESHDEKHLHVDDVLAIFMMCKACQLMYEDNGQIGTAKHFEYMFTTYINLFNENAEGFRNNRTTGIGFLSCHT